jgi:hypothetical protein
MLIPAGTPLEIPQVLAADIQSDLENRSKPRSKQVAKQRKIVSNQTRSSKTISVE